MGILVGYPNIGGTEKDLQLNFGLPISEQVNAYPSPSCWVVSAERSSAYLAPCRNRLGGRSTAMFVQIAREIASREKLLIVTPNPDEALKQIENQVNMDHVVFLQAETNDTWARDHGAITMPRW